MAANLHPPGAEHASAEHARAVLNILEDFSEERTRLEGAQKAVLNMLDDFSDEKIQLEGAQKAVLNILEDFSEERTRLEGAQKAVLNMLDDISDEKARLEGAQKAVLNILDDIGVEKAHLETSQKAILNMLEDLAVEKDRIEKARMELQEQSRRLEAANKELEAFSYSVSHDLRAPLRAIDGFSQALLEDQAERLDESGRDSLLRVRRAAQRMGLLIDDLLKLARVTRAELTVDDIDLSALAREIVEDLQASVPQRPAEFVIASGLSARGDPRLLRIVMENLLNNAWKFTAGREPARIEFGTTMADGGSAYFVRDNGVGFDMTYAEKLFGAFQRLHDANAFPGTGVGLATVQRIIHKHGGRVWARAENDKGATFYFTL
jgi:signal transduction histidine kinase